jgi:hypothetical protein
MIVECAKRTHRGFSLFDSEVRIPHPAFDPMPENARFATRRAKRTHRRKNKR